MLPAPSDLSDWYRAAWTGSDLVPPLEGHGRGERITRCFHEVIHNWTAPDRHYHTLVEHLQPMIQHIVEDLALVEGEQIRYRQRCLLLAAFYHDVRFDPQQPDDLNVQESLEFWGDHHIYVRGNLSPDERLRADVAELIAATDYGASTDRTHWDLRDYDLAGLADSWEDYKRKGDLIRAEVTGSGVKHTDAQIVTYARKQVQWLIRLLVQDRIYQDPSMAASHELAARSNLGRDLAERIQWLEAVKA